MKNIPKKINIMGRIWKVIIEEQDEDDPKCFGATDVYSQEITLYTIPHKTYPARGSIQASLFHECIHAALQSSGAGALLPEESGKEETVVTALEHALWPLIEQGLFK